MASMKKILEVVIQHGNEERLCRQSQARHLPISNLSPSIRKPEVVDEEKERCMSESLHIRIFREDPGLTFMLFPMLERIVNIAYRDH
ncbi:hypothetical protein PM082_024288 [Marasmius tenuissimus]|nr:hypothetical protein PM082_024288 [Marasmius tenuissimus]